MQQLTQLAPYTLGNHNPIPFRSAFFQKSEPKKRILIISSNDKHAANLSSTFDRKISCAVDVASDAYEAVNMIIESVYDLIVVDWSRPKRDIFETFALANKSIDQEVDLPSRIGVTLIPFILLGSLQFEHFAKIKSGHFRLIGCVPKLKEVSRQVDSIIRVVGHQIGLAG